MDLGQRGGGDETGEWREGKLVGMYCIREEYKKGKRMFESGIVYCAPDVHMEVSCG